MNVKYTFEKIGCIKKAEMELGNLTIIAGKNNTGKSYLTYSLYSILKCLTSYPSQHIFRRYWKDFDVTDANDEITISVQDINKYMRKYVNVISRYCSKELYTQFAASPKQFAESEVCCELLDELLDYRLITREIKYYFGYKSVIYDAENKLYRITHVKDGKYFVFVLYRLIRKIVPSVFILSSERLGISLFYKELDLTKNRIVEVLQNLPDEGHKEDYVHEPFHLEKVSARYAQPIKDNIAFTRDLEHIQKQKSPLADSVFFNDIKDMMGGYYKYANNGIRFISKAKKDKAFNIPLHIASSSARGLSDLYFYLKHVAEKGQLLIIDEPESHLDTENQILMARLLARCVNAGIKVLITTHSDYIVKEFNNLIMLSQEFESKDKFFRKYKRSYTENDYLKIKSVKGYTCENGGLTECEVTKYGIDMPVFDKTIDRINDISNVLVLRLEE